MSLIAVARTPGSQDVLSSLRAVCASQGLSDMESRLADLTDLVRWDMKDLEDSIAKLPEGVDIVEKSAHHLLDLGGKRLRPMCVALASRVGGGFSPAARELAVAVELVHCATLLHDDVVDVGDTRRGAPSARMVYGNAASIFAGDWLLVHALKRVRDADVSGTLGRLLDIIAEMIRGEAIQLESRGRIDFPEAAYFDIVEGKTAALFRWAMFAGGRAGGLTDEQCASLERYGRHLGVAFQLIDDVLDYAGDAAITGKALFTDLREGKMTYPLIVALERDQSLRSTLEAVLAAGEEAPSAGDTEALLDGLRRTGALDDCRALAKRHADDALRALSELPPGRATTALFTVAEATTTRKA